MTAAITLYALAVGLPLAVVGLAADRASALRRWPRRWIWAALLVAVVGLTVVAPWRAGAPPSEVTAGAVRGARAADAHDTPRDTRPSAGLGTLVRSRIDAAASSAARFEPVLLAAWLAASVLVALVFVVGRVTIARRRRQWRDATVRGVPVLVAPAVGPAVLGALSPRIVIPEWAFDLDVEALDLVLRHEQEHVRAGDPWLVYLAAAALVLLPWHPMVWWMASRLRLAVELDCDARVLGAPGAAVAEAAAYGELLLAVVERRPQRRLLATPALVESASSLATRIAALFPAAVRFAPARIAGAAVGALAAATFATLVPLPRVAAMSMATAHAAPVVPDAVIIAATAAPVALAPSALSMTPPSAYVAPGIDVAAAGRRPETTPAPEASRPSQPPLLPASSASLATLERAPAAAASLLAPPRVEPMAIASAPPPSPLLLGAPGLVAPVPVRVARPRYTSAAMRERLAGHVIVEAVVERDGSVGHVHVVESLDATFGLDEAAVEAAKQSLFRPGSLDGEPVAVTVTMEISFQIH